MANSGQTITHPQTGEKITFVRTAADTDGERLDIEVLTRPGSPPAPEHVHPQQTETFHVLEGAMRLMIDGRFAELRPGDAFEVAPGVAHTWVAVGTGELRVRCSFAPALAAEHFLEDYFALAHLGEMDAGGCPRHLPLMALLDDNPDVCYLATRPVEEQKAAVKVMAPVARARGYGRAVDSRTMSSTGRSTALGGAPASISSIRPYAASPFSMSG